MQRYSRSASCQTNHLARSSIFNFLLRLHELSTLNLEQSFERTLHGCGHQNTLMFIIIAIICPPTDCLIKGRGNQTTDCHHVFACIMANLCSIGSSTGEDLQQLRKFNYPGYFWWGGGAKESHNHSR